MLFGCCLKVLCIQMGCLYDKLDSIRVYDPEKYLIGLSNIS